MAEENLIQELFSDADIDSLNRELARFAILPENIISIFHVPGHIGDATPAQFRILYLQN